MYNVCTKAKLTNFVMRTTFKLTNSNITSQFIFIRLAMTLKNMIIENDKAMIVTSIV